jgi:hypothetical protein
MIAFRAQAIYTGRALPEGRAARATAYQSVDGRVLTRRRRSLHANPAACAQEQQQSAGERAQR